MARAALAVCLATVVAACSRGPGNPSPRRSVEPPTAETSTPIDEALRYVTPAAQFVGFLNWSILKQEEEIPRVTRDLTDEDRHDYYALFRERGLPPSWFDPVSLAFQEESWGWEPLDLRWELFMSDGRGGVHVLALENEISASDVVGKFEECGFEVENVAGSSVYTTTASNECIRRERTIKGVTIDIVTTSDAITNTAILDEQNVYVMSEDRSLVAGVLTTLEKGTAPADLTEVTERLSGTDAAAFYRGSDTCEKFGHFETPNLGPTVADFVGSSYEILAAGQSFGADEKAQVVLRYGSEAEARADEGIRRKAALENYSFKDFLPYDEFAFVTTDLRLQGTDLIFEFQPTAEGKLAVVERAAALDLLFAIC